MRPNTADRNFGIFPLALHIVALFIHTHGCYIFRDSHTGDPSLLFLVDALTSVSYTHLDVYKRQSLVTAGLR